MYLAATTDFAACLTIHCSPHIKSQITPDERHGKLVK
jgi:hypothetical protein